MVQQLHILVSMDTHLLIDLLTRAGILGANLLDIRHVDGSTSKRS
jgi:hypothetical protein